MAASMLQTNSKNPGTYTYSSQPRAVHEEKYRTESAGYGNIMYDKRVVRGNTYALHTLPASSQPDPLELQRQQEARRRALARKRAREQFKPRSPEPVEGRKHIDVQTELYLEEITDRIEEADVHTQTDAFLDRPPTPLFIPAKTGLDAATQIGEAELFDFDLEVKPILEVLVGKTVEQSLLEVMEEEELASLRAQQCVFEENRNAERVETQRLQEQERRRHQEKERRMKQQRDALLKEKETSEKVASRAFAQSYLADLVPSVFTRLSQDGFFYDPVEREVESIFLPWLMREAEIALDEKILSRVLLDALIHETVIRMIESAKTPTISVPVSDDSPTMMQEPPPAEDVDSSGLKVGAAIESDEKRPEDTESTTGEEGKGEQAKERAKDDITDTEKTESDKDEEPDKTESVSLDLPGDQSDSQPAAESESAETVPPGGESEGADQPEDEGAT